MSPHLPHFDRDILFRLIRSNVIPRAELRPLDEQYDRLFQPSRADEPVACHVFASMFKIGLLGYVGMHPETAELVQFFRYPGEVPLDRNDVLPDAEQFLIHPSLDLLIGSYNPDYFRHLDKLNVIGADRPWRPARQTLFVLKGDVRGAGAIFQDPVAGTHLSGFLRRGGGRSRARSPVRQAMDGDAALLVDPNPRQVVLAAMALRQRMLRSDYGCDMRFGGDAGFVDVAQENGKVEARAGLALLVAARLEPHAAAGHDPGHRPVRRRLARSIGGGRTARARSRSSRSPNAAGNGWSVRSRQAGRRGTNAAATDVPGRSDLGRIDIWRSRSARFAEMVSRRPR